MPSDIRIQKDLEDLDLPPNCSLYTIPSDNGSLPSSRGAPMGGPLDRDGGGPPTFLLTLTPDEGYWRNGKIRFEIRLPDNYPHDPPKVKCKDKACPLGFRV